MMGAITSSSTSSPAIIGKLSRARSKPYSRLSSSSSIANAAIGISASPVSAPLRNVVPLTRAPSTLTRTCEALRASSALMPSSRPPSNPFHDSRLPMNTNKNTVSRSPSAPKLRCAGLRMMRRSRATAPNASAASNGERCSVCAMPVSSSTRIAKVTVEPWLLVVSRFSHGAITPNTAPATSDSAST